MNSVLLLLGAAAVGSIAWLAFLVRREARTPEPSPANAANVHRPTRPRARR